MEERLRFYEDGVAPTKNLTAMQDALRKVAEDSPEGEEPVAATPADASAKKKKVHFRRSSLDSVSP